MFDVFRKKFDRTTPDVADRVPPGQYLTEKFPVLHYGDVPIYRDLEQTWDLRVWGEIEAPAHFSFAEFRALPTIQITTDIHCVTRWSKLDTQWEGVQFTEFLAQLPPLKPTARHVLFHCEQGFTANVPLDLMREPDALLAYKYAGAELTPEHGFPLRSLVPKKYFWKSAKWLRGIEFLSEDRLGFWERYGYSNSADPWKEERYSE
ncbi:MAG TPA: sulfite oxidase-like oxidoreductase [Roseiflexaceae bacterium]|nr:sulfite oxidase-like oxidoreductase [Roseiflexaceae bacterium]HMP41482.1 sulfite oxidase-like oxidoreductase [Roseiflexaceae bacterium]